MKRGGGGRYKTNHTLLILSVWFPVCCLNQTRVFLQAAAENFAFIFDIILWKQSLDYQTTSSSPTASQATHEQTDWNTAR